MNNFKLSILFVLQKNKTNNKRKYPIKCRITFLKRVILMGFCTKKALKMSLLGHFTLWTKRSLELRARMIDGGGSIIIKGD